jgi:hypothetical protein
MSPSARTARRPVDRNENERLLQQKDELEDRTNGTAKYGPQGSWILG